MKVLDCVVWIVLCMLAAIKTVNRIIWRVIVATCLVCLVAGGLIIVLDKLLLSTIEIPAIGIAIFIIVLLVALLLGITTFWYWDAILLTVKGLIWLLLEKIFPPLSYKGVVNTQIAVYKKLKKREPKMPEDKLLNLLITSRVEAPPRVASKQDEYTHYESLLKNPNKTLEDVILAIVEYEYILSRSEFVIDRGFRVGLSLQETLANIDRFKSKARKYITERIKRKP